MHHKKRHDDADKILLKKSHKITHPFINFIFIARKLNNPSEKSNVYFDISSEKGRESLPN